MRIRQPFGFSRRTSERLTYFALASLSVQTVVEQQQQQARSNLRVLRPVTSRRIYLVAQTDTHGRELNESTDLYRRSRLLRMF